MEYYRGSRGWRIRVRSSGAARRQQQHVAAICDRRLQQPPAHGHDVRWLPLRRRGLGSVDSSERWPFGAGVRPNPQIPPARTLVPAARCHAGMPLTGRSAAAAMRRASALRVQRYRRFAAALAAAAGLRSPPPRPQRSPAARPHRCFAGTSQPAAHSLARCDNFRFTSPIRHYQRRGCYA